MKSDKVAVLCTPRGERPFDFGSDSPLAISINRSNSKEKSIIKSKLVSILSKFSHLESFWMACAFPVAACTLSLPPDIEGGFDDDDYVVVAVVLLMLLAFARVLIE